MSGLYLHIPFCKQACYYCDFHFSTDQRHKPELVGAVCAELVHQKDYLNNDPLGTIYFGGGTPSLLNAKEMDVLFKTIHEHYHIAAHAEITLEANPDDLTIEKLQDLRSAGFNRLSIGIQSFDDAFLKYMNRAHQSTAAIESLEAATKAGFNNISLDLIYAIPGLTESKWRETIQQALNFAPQHISAYALTIEDKTVFGDWRRKGKLKAVTEETEAIHFEILMDTLGEAGFEHYEISNFARPGFISKHNSAYWRGIHYLGIGPSAHSYNGISRQFNIRNNAQYIRAIETSKPAYERELLSRENKINEYILTNLRTSWGCDLQMLKTVFYDDLQQRQAEYLNRMVQQGLISLDGDILKLTRKGKFLADQITEDLMIG